MDLPSAFFQTSSPFREEPSNAEAALEGLLNKQSRVKTKDTVKVARQYSPPLAVALMLHYNLVDFLHY